MAVRAVSHGADSERLAWLEQLPDVIRELQRRWSLTIGGAWAGSEGSCAWVAPAVRADGTRVVLKLGMPHLEGAHELDGLRFWNGEPTVRLLEADADLNAMLLERCEPGSSLRELPEPEQDLVIAALLRRLWRKPPASHRFRQLQPTNGRCSARHHSPLRRLARCQPRTPYAVDVRSIGSRATRTLDGLLNWSGESARASAVGGPGAAQRGRAA